jgi:hypothetical protein
MRHICCTMKRIRLCRHPPPPPPGWGGGNGGLALCLWEDMRTCSLPAGPVRQGKEDGPVQEPPAQGQVGMGGVGTYGTADSWELSRQLERGACWCNTDSVVGERFYEAILPSPHPWQSPDCIPIVGSARSLVPSDKRFNHIKVWYTFIFIDLQAR